MKQVRLVDFQDFSSSQVRFPGLEWLGSGLDGGYPDYDPYGACIESISPTDFSV